LFRHALAVTSRNVVAHNSLGFYYVAQSNAEEAKRAFRAALAIQPACQYSWQGLGTALIEQRKYTEAIAACKSALEVDPGIAAAHSTLARKSHNLIEQRSGDGVRRLENTEPNENATRRFF
jgi:tetratricopeptide (TPR) repeat protein